MLDDANQQAQQLVPETPIAQNGVVADWREAYRKFKTKKGARSSIENLLKRAQQGKPVSSINPLVDLYNVISLRHALPCGGENIDAMVGDIKLTVADGGEPFHPLGEDDEEPALPGEVVYKDDAGIICRCWNWRDGERTMLTEDTSNAFLCLECVNPERKDALEAALADLKELTKAYLNADAETSILTIDQPRVVID
ncbi:B3/B4 domain-containing protein [Furfurilactobacillus milii]|uniref:B3/B4 domain-containing protein n=1 Tax=Furfurilactobacillus milii TaxID=2888272 RepID=UPI003265EBF4